MNEKTAQARAAVLATHQGRCDGVAGQLESPIEVALYWALLAEGLGWGQPRVEYDTQYGSWFQIQTDLEDMTISPQRSVQANGRTYRLDFHVEVETTGGWANTRLPPIRAAVECDGHDFHERTKQQAARDRKRDRDLQAAGFLVLRFTGSEIFRDAGAVAAEIVNALNVKARAAFDDWYEANAPKKGE